MWDEPGRPELVTDKRDAERDILRARNRSDQRVNTAPNTLLPNISRITTMSNATTVAEEPSPTASVRCRTCDGSVAGCPPSDLTATDVRTATSTRATVSTERKEREDNRDQNRRTARGDRRAGARYVPGRFPIARLVSPYYLLAPDVLGRTRQSTGHGSGRRPDGSMICRGECTPGGEKPADEHADQDERQFVAGDPISHSRHKHPKCWGRREVDDDDQELNRT